MSTVPLSDHSPPGLAPLLGIDDLVHILNVNRRTVERMRSGGQLPRADLCVGRLPRWMPSTIETWLKRGGK